jgi:hypothetical protein
MSVLEAIWRNHYPLLLDSIRMNAYASAITKGIRPDDVVIDIGSGTGVLAVMAAKSGARLVYAVERDESLIPTIAATCRANGVADRVRIVKADFRELNASAFDEEPTAIVSELFGYFAPHEGVHEVCARAVQMFSKQLRFVPASYRLGAAPVSDVNFYDSALSDICGVDMRAFGRDRTSATFERRVPEGDLCAADAWSDPIYLIDPRPTECSWLFHFPAETLVRGIVVFFSTFLDDVCLSTSPRAPETSWSQIVVPSTEATLVTSGGSLRATLFCENLQDRSRWECNFQGV